MKLMCAPNLSNTNTNALDVALQHDKSNKDASQAVRVSQHHDPTEWQEQLIDERASVLARSLQESVAIFNSFFLGGGGGRNVAN